MKTTTINGVKITETKSWSFESVRRCCIKNDFYTSGSNESYAAMLREVETLEPTTENIYKIAKNIYHHTAGQNIENVMFCLAADAIHTFYDVEKIEQ